MDFGAILRETAREVYSILDRAAPVWSPNRGRRFHAKEPQKHIAYNSVFRERNIQPTVYFSPRTAYSAADCRRFLGYFVRNTGGAIAGLCAVRAPFWGVILKALSNFVRYGGGKDPYMCLPLKETTVHCVFCRQVERV